MMTLLATSTQRLGWTFLAFGVAVITSVWLLRHADTIDPLTLSDGELMQRLFILPSFFAAAVFIFVTACAGTGAKPATSIDPQIRADVNRPFLAQVVGVQWLNPLQRRDYPTEWQLLWTLGLVAPNIDDDMVKAEPALFSKLQAVASIANGNNGRESFVGFHEKYIHKLIYLFRDIYFSSSTYFYNAHSLEDKKTWRELAGIHIEYALPEGRLDSGEAGSFLRQTVVDAFDIGNPHFPNSWTKGTPPDVQVTMGGPSAGAVV